MGPDELRCRLVMGLSRIPCGGEADREASTDFPRRAYNLIYNEYYRDENLIDEVAHEREHSQEGLGEGLFHVGSSHGNSVVLLPLCLFLVHLMPFGQPPLRMETQIGLIR